MSKKQKPMVRWRLGSGIGGRGPRELQSESNEVEEGRGLRAFVVRSMMRKEPQGAEKKLGKMGVGYKYVSILLLLLLWLLFER